MLLDTTTKCPCCSEKFLVDCCGPLLKGKAHAASPVQLMRSRYSAFYFKNEAYFLATTHVSTRPHADPVGFKDWGEKITWKGLQVKAVSPIVKGRGKVLFAAWYMEDGKLACIHEHSNFLFEDDRWFYVDGKQLSRPSVGRNDACICGSGRKFKKCCG